MRPPPKPWILCLGGLLLAAAPEHLSASTQEEFRVLVLFPEQRLYPIVAEIDASLRETLGADPSRHIVLYTDFIEFSRFVEEDFEANLLDFLRRKYARHRIDAVVSCLGDTFRFVQQNRARLFPDTPLVFSIVESRELKEYGRPRHSTGVLSRFDFAPTLEAALRLQPGTRRVVTIIGASPWEQFWEAEARREFQPYADRLRFEWWAGRPLPEMLRDAAKLPPDSIVFYVVVRRDSAGNTYNPEDVATRIVEASTVPVYAANELWLPSGIAGGRLFSPREQGRQTGELVLRILNGEVPDDIPLVEAAANRDLFNWQTLQRFGLNEARLPPGSEVRFRRPSQWEEHKWEIIGVTGVIALQMALIIGLMVQRRNLRRAERKLARSEQRLRTITDALPVLIAYVDRDQRYRFVNEAHRAWFGLDPAEMIGRTMREVLGSPLYETIRPQIERAVAGEHVQDVVDSVVLDGRVRSIEAIYVPDRGGGDTVRGFYGLVLDVSELYRARQDTYRLQSELAHAGRISMMGELAASLAHELNQPLTAILSNAQAALRFMADNPASLEEVREILADIVADDNRAGEIIRRMRSLARRGALDLEPLDLNLIIREVVAFLASDARTRGIKILPELHDLPGIRGDRIHLLQVLLNLLLNAFEAMERTPAVERRVRIHAEQKADGMIRVSVRDRGTGLRDDELDRIFEPFHTSKPEGLGLGLSISRSIIEAHGGRLWAESNPDGGATFHFTLAVAGAVRDEGRGTEQASEPAVAGGNWGLPQSAGAPSSGGLRT
jgi:PAS domain S-box-containing protein